MIDSGGSIFSGRTASIASMHKKHEVIAPVLSEDLNVNSFWDFDIDTDVLGTFSGEVERKNNPKSTAIEKCKLGLEMSGLDLGIATEASFGPHPSIPWVGAHQEIVVLVDVKNDLIISESILTLDTNFNHRWVGSESELLTFLEHCKFPSHGVILIGQSNNERKEIVKNLNKETDVLDCFRSMLKRNLVISAETDMRAMNNPTRMRIIEDATRKLCQKANSICPNCGMNGFGDFEFVSGLPCFNCQLPTGAPMSKRIRCVKCQFEVEEKFPFGKTNEDPMYCNFCNP
jgi:hypothetical protein